MKRVTAVFAAIAVALSLTACSNNSESGNNESEKRGDDNSVHESSNADNGIETVKNKSVTIRLNNASNDVIYCGEWADGKPNGDGHFYYNQHNEWVGVFDGHFIDGELSGKFITLAYSNDGDYEFGIGNVADGTIDYDIYCEQYFNSASPYFKFRKNEGTEYKEYKVSNGAIKDISYEETLSGTEAEKVLAQMEVHFGYAEDFNELRVLLDDYIKDNGLDFEDLGNYANLSTDNYKPTLVNKQDIGDGRIYSGYMVDGIPNGSGELRQRFDNGWNLLEIGAFEGGKLSGNGRFMQIKGGNFFFAHGEFSADMLSGYGYEEDCFIEDLTETHYRIGTFLDGNLVEGEHMTAFSDFSGLLEVGSFNDYTLRDGYELKFDRSGKLVSLSKFTNGKEQELSPAQISEISELQKYDATYLTKVVSTHYDYNDSFNEMKTALGN